LGELGFVMLFGTAAIIRAGADAAYERAAEGLRGKYSQYRGLIALHQWMIEIKPHRGTSWGAI